jgi:hypothetical protein
VVTRLTVGDGDNARATNGVAVTPSTPTGFVIELLALNGGTVNEAADESTGVVLTVVSRAPKGGATTPNPVTTVGLVAFAANGGTTIPKVAVTVVITFLATNGGATRLVSVITVGVVIWVREANGGNVTPAHHPGI